MTAFEAGAGYGGQNRGGGPATILGGGSEPLVLPRRRQPGL